MNKKTDILIIGAGVSGLGCAHVLDKAKKDFLIIGSVLGGRIHAESAGSEVPYGTAYSCEDYFHMIPFTEKGSSSKRSLSDYYFFDGRNYIPLLHWKNIKHIPALLRLKKELKKFRQHIINYRVAMETKSLKEIFTEDEYLKWTWETPAKDFIKQYKLEAIDEFMVNPIVATTTYAQSDEINVAYYLGMALPMVVPTWRADFSPTVERMTAGIQDRIIIEEVVSIRDTRFEILDSNIESRISRDYRFTVQTSMGQIEANTLVFAAPYKAIGHLFPGIPAPYRQEDIHVLNVHGVRKPPYDNKPVVFLRAREHDGLYSLFGPKPGVDLVYSKKANPDLSKYYESYEIVKDVYWDPVMNVPDSRLIDNKIEDQVYLAGDYNISGLEDAYVSGLSVGNRILRET